MREPEPTGRMNDRALTRFLARAAGGTFLLRLVYLAAGFATTLLLTNWLGAENLGIYSFVMSWILLSIIIVKFGFEEFLIREIAACNARNHYAQATQVWNFARAFVLAGSAASILVIGLILSFTSFTTPGLSSTFWWSLPIIPLMALIGLYRSRIRARKQIIVSQIPEFVVRPILLMGLIGATLTLGYAPDPTTAVLLNLLATAAALASCAIASRYPTEENGRKVVDPIHASKPTSAWPWLIGAMPFVAIAGLQMINSRADRLMLGTLVDMESVGYYSVAIQMAMVVNFPLLGVSQGVAPLAAERHEGRRGQELQRTLIRVTVGATLASVLIVLALAILGPFILTFFGDGFRASYGPMLILAAGQLANVAAGPAGTILAMCNQERLVAAAVLVAAFANLILNLILIPKFGIHGAALATSISMVVWSALLVVFAKVKLGISANVLALFVPMSPAR